MLMRRLAHSLKEQNWTAIAVEFVLLVLGVFLGIQAANWNEARVERALVRGHLSEIAIDLRTHLALDPELEGSTRMRIAAVDHIYREAFGVRLPGTLVLATQRWQAPPAEAFPPDQLDHLMGSVNLVRISSRSSNGYESLMNSGRLGLVRNRALARQIQTYYGNYADMQDATGFFRSMRNDGARDQFPLGVSLWDDRPATEVIALARSNPGFAAYLRSQREMAILHYNRIRNVGAATKSLLAAIEQELAAP